MNNRSTTLAFIGTSTRGHECDLLEAGGRYLNAGLCVLPASLKEKHPVLDGGWKQYLQDHISRDELAAEFADSGNDAVCIVCGVTSGNVECVDFDAQGELYEPWRKLVDERSPGLRDRLYVESSPSGGRHVIYRCDSQVPGSLKLAVREIETQDDLPIEHQGKKFKPRKCGERWVVSIGLIETRGEGALVVCAPSSGYNCLQGDITNLPLLTATEREILISSARAFDEVVPRDEGDAAGASVPPHGRPGDEFNERGDVSSVLEKCGWRLYRDGENEYWTRPGKAGGCSATFNGTVFYCFSSNAPPFEMDQGYSKFAVYALLEHDGDFHAAAADLVRQGYGASTGARPRLSNFRVIEGDGEHGEKARGKQALSICDMHSMLQQATKGWPRRVGNLLFTDEQAQIRWLEQPVDLSAWLQEKFELRLATGAAAGSVSFVTRAEFFSHLRATVTHYDGVEVSPHEPQLPNLYYAWCPPEGYVADGHYLSEMVEFFDNSETAHDRTLIRAAFMTATWGGRPGMRPAFCINSLDRGQRKTSLAESIGHLYYGHVDLPPGKWAEEKFVTRLLSPDALTKRVVLVDNLKGEYESALVEGLITRDVISGHRLFHGEASRPNTLTWVITANSLAMSRDLAERCFFVRLTKPMMRRNWREDLSLFIETNRAFILADIVAELRKPPMPFTHPARYGSWVSGVLSKCGGDVDLILTLNAQRQGACDEEIEEGRTIMEAVDRRIRDDAGLHHVGLATGTWSPFPGKVPPREGCWFISSADLPAILDGSVKGGKNSTTSLSRMLKAHVDAGRLPRLAYNEQSRRGYYVQLMDEQKEMLARSQGLGTTRGHIDYAGGQGPNDPSGG